MSEAPDREGKTEEPTQKRLSDSKEKGKGPFSRELPGMLNAVAIWLALSTLMGAAVIQIVVSLIPFIDRPGMWHLRSASDVSQLLQYLCLYVLSAALPIVAVIGVSGLLGSVPQSNGLVLERLKPDLSRISPAAGWKRLFGRAGLSNAAKSLVKIALVGAVAVWSLRDLSATFIAAGAAGAAGAPELGQFIASALSVLVRNMLGVILLVAGADLVMVRYFWRRDLMMTKQEVKDEAKEADGDQAVKHRMRLLARQRLKKRMMAAVPGATVVIANPTHFAVALRYVQSEGGAPRVVAKGRDALALRIRAVAEEHGVPVVENKALARALHDSVPLDAYLPPEFYKAVAQIISSIMKRPPRR